MLGVNFERKGWTEEGRERLESRGKEDEKGKGREGEEGTGTCGRREIREEACFG